MNKVCVHTIARNELKRIDRWWNTVKDADLIVVLDTGSTDNSSVNKWNKLYSANKNLKFFAENLETHFGHERQRSLDLAMSEIDNIKKDDDEWIIINLDLDEFMDDGWVPLLKKEWKKGYDCLNITADAHRNTPEYSQTVIWRKVHSFDYNWVWTRRVHETLFRSDKKRDDFIIGDSSLVFSHEQEGTREWYLTLLEEENKEENYTDTLTLTLLAWEYLLKDKLDEAKVVIDKCLSLYKENKIEKSLWLYGENEEKQKYIQNLFYLMMINHNKNINQDESLDIVINLLNFVETENQYPKFRELYNKCGFICEWCNQPLDALQCYIRALKTQYLPNTWIEDYTLYDNRIFYRKIANIYRILKDYKSAYMYASLGESEDLESYKEKVN